MQVDSRNPIRFISYINDKVKQKNYFPGSEKLSDGISDVVSGIQFNKKLYVFNNTHYWRMER